MKFLKFKSKDKKESADKESVPEENTSKSNENTSSEKISQENTIDPANKKKGLLSGIFSYKSKTKKDASQDESQASTQPKPSKPTVTSKITNYAKNIYKEFKEMKQSEYMLDLAHGEFIQDTHVATIMKDQYEINKDDIKADENSDDEEYEEEDTNEESQQSGAAGKKAEGTEKSGAGAAENNSKSGNEKTAENKDSVIKEPVPSDKFAIDVDDDFAIDDEEDNNTKPEEKKVEEAPQNQEQEHMTGNENQPEEKPKPKQKKKKENKIGKSGGGYVDAWKNEEFEEDSLFAHFHKIYQIDELMEYTSKNVFKATSATDSVGLTNLFFNDTKHLRVKDGIFYVLKLENSYLATIKDAYPLNRLIKFEKRPKKKRINLSFYREENHVFKQKDLIFDLIDYHGFVRMMEENLVKVNSSLNILSQGPLLQSDN